MIKDLPPRLRFCLGNKNHLWCCKIINLWCGKKHYNSLENIHQNIPQLNCQCIQILKHIWHTKDLSALKIFVRGVTKRLSVFSWDFLKKPVGASGNPPESINFRGSLEYARTIFIFRISKDKIVKSNWNIVHLLGRSVIRHENISCTWIHTFREIGSGRCKSKLSIAQ